MGWSAWSVVSNCNKACGLGKQRERRLCDSPAPTNGGKQCVKEDGKLALVEEKSVDCQVRECPGRPTYGGKWVGVFEKRNSYPTRPPQLTARSVSGRPGQHVRQSAAQVR